jgi:hypothetical protein
VGVKEDVAEVEAKEMGPHGALKDRPHTTLNVSAGIAKKLAILLASAPNGWKMKRKRKRAV